MWAVPGQRPAGPVTLPVAAQLVREVIAAGPCLVVLIGAAGSGKSTLARQACGDDTGQILSLDTLRWSVSGDECDQDATTDAVAVLHLLAEARLRRGLATIIDATNADPRARTPLLAIARRHHVPAVAVAMVTPERICLARNAARPGPRPGARWGRRVPDATVRAQHTRVRTSVPSLANAGFAQVITCAQGQMTQ